MSCNEFVIVVLLSALIGLRIRLEFHMNVRHEMTREISLRKRQETPYVTLQIINRKDRT